MSTAEQQTKPDGGASVSTDGLERMVVLENPAGVQIREDKRAKTDKRFQVASAPMTLVLDTSILNKFAAPYGGNHA